MTEKYTSFTVDTFDTLMQTYKVGVNDFLIRENLQPIEAIDGGAYYLAFYPIAQKIIETQAKYNEILTAIYEFPIVSQQVISRNNSIQDTFINAVYKEFGIECNFKELEEATAGTVSLAFNFTNTFIDSTDNRLKLYQFMNENLVAGLWYYGDDVGVRLDDTYYKLYPAKKVIRNVKIEYKVKKYNDYPVLNPQEIRDIFQKNFNAKYRLNTEFSNEEYLSYLDLPFASFINLKLIDPLVPDIEVNAPVLFNFDERMEINNINVIELV